MAKRKIRHEHDERWYTSTLVKERQEVETPWGTAWAEIGSYILTDVDDPEHQVICTKDDLKEMTSKKVPLPPPPGPETRDTAKSVLVPPWLPGMEEPNGS